MSNMPLYTLDPLNRFSDRASDYVKYRPTYPRSAIDAILAGLATPLIAADVGAGTGISARLFGDRGVRVWAIEPNPAMSALAEPHPQVEFRQATAEQTGLPDRSIDLVTCFQAFHWFNPDPTLAEFARILKPGGRLAPVWNTRDYRDSFTNEYGELLRQASNKHPALDSSFNRAEAMPTSEYFTNFREMQFPLEQPLDLPALIGNAKSRSYAPTDPATLNQLIRDLEDLYQRYKNDQGVVTVKYLTKVFMAESLDQG